MGSKVVAIKTTETFIENDIIVDGVKVGYVELCKERDEITRLEIFDPYRNKGYGTKVINCMVNHGYNKLWVRSDNEHAIHVYEKCGFVKGEETMLEMHFERKTDE